MPSATYNLSVSSGGITIQGLVARSADGQIGIEATLPAGKAGTLTTRTDNDTGVVTVASGHGITASDTVDLYWSGGRRYGVDVTAVAATTIDIDLGAGDNLPSASTAVVICKQVTINVAIDGDAVALLALNAKYADSTITSKCHATLKDSGAAVIEEVDLTGNSPQVWDITGGATNVFTGNPIVSCHASNGNAASDATFQCVGVYDSTP